MRIIVNYFLKIIIIDGTGGQGQRPTIPLSWHHGSSLFTWYPPWSGTRNLSLCPTSLCPTPYPM